MYEVKLFPYVLDKVLKAIYNGCYGIEEKHGLLHLQKNSHVPVFKCVLTSPFVQFVCKEASRDQIKYLLVDNEHETVDGAKVERLLDKQDHGGLKSTLKIFILYPYMFLFTRILLTKEDNTCAIQ